MLLNHTESSLQFYFFLPNCYLTTVRTEALYRSKGEIAVHSSCCNGVMWGVKYICIAKQSFSEWQYHCSMSSALLNMSYLLWMSQEETFPSWCDIINSLWCIMTSHYIIYDSDYYKYYYYYSIHENAVHCIQLMC